MSKIPSKVTKLFAALCVAGAALAAMPDAAFAQRHHSGGGWHGGGGHWHGGGGHWRGGGWRGGGWGPGFAIGFGAPYYYGGGPYYYGDSCGYTRVRVWRNGRWVLRRVYRCY